MFTPTHGHDVKTRVEDSTLCCRQREVVCLVHPQQGKRMAKVVLASALSRWLPQTPGKTMGEIALEVSGANVGEVLDGLFALHPNLRGYVVDEHGAVRHHVAVFVDGDAIRDKHTLTQPLAKRSEVYVMQALSGG